MKHNHCSLGGEKNTEHLQKYVKITIVGIHKTATVDTFPMCLIFYTYIKICVHPDANARVIPKCKDLLTHLFPGF